jgi:diketogulonate reductase-like aldo/keto reductase
MDIGSSITLANGVALPVLGLGVFRAQPGEQTRDAVGWALEAGYRHIDTAHAYHNEEDVGAALRESGLPRDDVFVTTKLANGDHGFERALRAFEESLAALGTDYVDLYLIHWPVADLRRESWRALERLYAEKRVRAVGVCNYTRRHLEELLGYTDTPPHVDQVELHPFLYQLDLLRFCRVRDIAVEAYSPLTRGRRLRDREVQALAVTYGKTPAQVLLRWGLQRGLAVLPKSVHRERIVENAALFDFELSDEDMARLDALDEGLHVAWDPTDAP